MTDGPIITIQEARKILGKDAQKLTDQEVEKLIDDLNFIARYAIKHFKSKRREQLNPHPIDAR